MVRIIILSLVLVVVFITISSSDIIRRLHQPHQHVKLWTRIALVSAASTSSSSSSWHLSDDEDIVFDVTMMVMVSESHRSGIMPSPSKPPGSNVFNDFILYYAKSVSDHETGTIHIGHHPIPIPSPSPSPSPSLYQKRFFFPWMQQTP